MIFNQVLSWAALTASIASFIVHAIGHAQHKLVIDDIASRLRELEGGGGQQSGV